MKLYAYIASYNDNNSSCFKYFNELIDKLKTKINIEKLIVHSPDKYNIKNCIGCTNCFIKGNCLLDDDMKNIKNYMIESDIIVLVSPVYAHNVPGNLKTFIDRIAHWSHLMHLTGKKAIIITVASNNGLNETEEYLKKILLYLGVSILDSIKIYTEASKVEGINSILDVSASNISNRIQQKKYIIENMQELYFKFLKENIYKLESDNFERNYWESSGKLEFDSFRELFDSYSNL